MLKLPGMDWSLLEGAMVSLAVGAKGFELLLLLPQLIKITSNKTGAVTLLIKEEICMLIFL